VAEDPGALRRDVEDARAQLGETVDALSFKVTQPRRFASRAAGELRERLTPQVIAALGGAALLAVLLLVRRGGGS
jgi:Protein of unknown function (DUF3618)